MATKYLPEEIITQILYSVPAKSIGKFRSVSKGWLSLLTHPDFIKTHRNTLDKHHLIYSSINRPALYSNSYKEPILRPSDFLDIESGSDYNCVQKLILCGSCNGLVLVTSMNQDETYTLVLLNPTTKESMVLPDYFSDLYLRAYEYIEFDIMAGLGYASETGDFKVVSITCVHHTIPMTDASRCMHVYSLKTNSWRNLIVDSINDYRFIPSKPECVFVNGFLHWIAEKRVNYIRHIVILAFSLEDDKFSEVPSPEFVKSTKVLSRSYCQLVVLGEKLALFHEIIGEIWLMNEYRIKESWTKISLHGTPTVITVEAYHNKVFYHNGKFMVAKGRRMIMYDEKGNFDKIVSFSDRGNCKVNGSYMESLVSIASCIEE